MAEPTRYYLSPAEAAAFLGVSTAWLEKARQRGGDEGPDYRKHGHLVLYDPADLRKWSDARVRKSTSKSPSQAAARNEGANA